MSRGLHNMGLKSHVLEEWPCPPPDPAQRPDVTATKNKKPLFKKKEKRNASLPRTFERLNLVEIPVPTPPKPIKTKKKDNAKRKSGGVAALRCAASNCSGYVYPPATACGAPGHGAVCVTCAAWWRGRCPLCPAPPAPKENASVAISPRGRPIAFHLEELAEHLLLPCRFRPKGCHFRFPEEELLLHQVECRFAPKACFSTKCDFLGDNMDLATHMDEVHAERVIKDTEAEYSLRKINTRTEGVHHVQYLRCIYGEFWVKYEYSGTEMQLYAAVQYIGPKQEAEKLVYEFEMKEYDNNKYTGLKAVYTGKMSTHIKTFETLFEIEDCFSVSLDFAQYFENNDVLQLTVRIKEADGSI